MDVINRKFPANLPLVLIWALQGAIWPSCHGGAAAADDATHTVAVCSPSLPPLP